MTEVWVDMEYHMRVKVNVPRNASEDDIFERAYAAAVLMDPTEMVHKLDLEYWEVVD